MFFEDGLNPAFDARAFFDLGFERQEAPVSAGGVDVALHAPEHKAEVVVRFGVIRVAADGLIQRRDGFVVALKIDQHHAKIVPAQRESGIGLDASLVFGQRLVGFLPVVMIEPGMKMLFGQSAIAAFRRRRGNRDGDRGTAELGARWPTREFEPALPQRRSG